MVPIRSTLQQTPQIDATARIFETAVVVGDVVIGANSSVWFGAVIRGDVHSIRIGRRTNIQDLSMVHVTAVSGPCNIGDDVTIGHKAMLHGCTIENRVLIGMGAIVLDNALIGSETLVAAGSIVPARMKIPPGVLVMGAPARIKRDLTEKEKQDILESAKHYVAYQELYQ